MKPTVLLMLATILAPRAAAGQDISAMQQSCNDGDAVACHELGSMFRTGEGVERDLLRAAVYQERACNEGAMQGCAALGLMHLRGEGVAQDRRRALDLLGRACEADVGSACTSLGTMYAEGRVIEQDLELASEYFDRACDQGDLSGCANLGVLYERGAGVEADAERAKELFRSACRGGVSAACSLLTGGSWNLVAYETDPASPRAVVRTRSAAGAPATLDVSCTPAEAGVAVEWLGTLPVEEPPLTTMLGSETTEADDWRFDPTRDRHSYGGDARALIADLSRLEGQPFFVSPGEGSTSFTLTGLSEVTVVLAAVCGW